MIKALLLIFDPINTWDKIVRGQRSFVFLLGVYLMPMLVISCAGELYGVATWGKRYGRFDHLGRLPENVVIAYGIGQFVIGLLVVLVGAKVIKSVAESFHGRPGWKQCFGLVAYSLGPMFLVRLVDACPVINVWLTWGGGMLLSISVLYHGLPRMLRPDPAHAFGLYLISVLLLMMVTGLGRFLTWLVLQGEFAFLSA